MKRKILNINTAGLWKEGITATQLDLMSGLDKELFQIDMAEIGESDPDVIERFRAMGCGIVSFPDRETTVLSYLMALHRKVRKERYDIVYVHGSSALLSIELVTAWLAGCKSRIVHSHSTSCQHKFLDWLLRPIFYHSYIQALACGTAAGKWLYGSRPFQIIKNGRDVETYRFSPEKRREIRQKLGLDETVLAIGHVGNFTLPKNQGYLAEVLKEVLKQKKDIRLYLMGDGERREAVERKFREQGLDKYVVFTGNISNVPDMLQAMDVMVLPSLYEGLPLVSVEWQIAALPCILSETVTKECAYTDLVHFLPLGEPQQWAGEILELGKFDRVAYADTAIARTVESGFDLDRNAKQLEHIFLECVPTLKNKKEEEPQ